jgi:hypothetical protein
VTARLVGNNEKKSRRRAFCLALAFILQPAIGFGTENTSRGVSSEVFETFLRSKNIIPSAAGENTNVAPPLQPGSQAVASPSDKQTPSSSPPQAVHSVAPSILPATEPPSDRTLKGPSAPIANSQVPVAPNADNKAANASVSPLAPIAPSSTSPAYNTNALSSQPGVELFVPSDSDTLNHPSGEVVGGKSHTLLTSS